MGYILPKNAAYLRSSGAENLEQLTAFQLERFLAGQQERGG
jgi:hypothetical protein